MTKSGGLNFVEVYEPSTERTSSILANSDGLIIVGVLNHNSKIQPKNIEDADFLIEWLNQWKDKRVNEDRALGKAIRI